MSSRTGTDGRGVTRRTGSRLRLRWVIAIGGAIALGACAAHGQEQPDPSDAAPSGFSVDGRVALHSLASLSDAHLQELANIMTLLATTDAARSGEWERIRAPLAEAARPTVPAVNWFALPDGTYWTLEEGLAAERLADRPYFPRLLAGQTVIGDLVVSRATGRSTAIVAVPVRGAEGAIVGALGASVHLDSLSMQLQREMQLGPDHLFYSLDAEPVVGLHLDPEVIFLRPLEEGDPDLERGIREILSREQGIVTYTFRGTRRTVLFRKSPVTGWWYAFGMLHPRRAGADPDDREDGAMATYVMTFQYTQQGIQQVKDSPARVEAAKQTIESLGGEVEAFYAVLGADYDTMFIVEAPDEEAVARMALAISSQGSVRSSTHRAFAEHEFERIVSGMP